ncbi:MAG: AraC family transcriptional regulator [Candidatus Thiodiazotropha taylori]|nr:AraC family transcriptional regulator [Candidatus Thiodiazotropha taylori]MCG8028014.1 AraC family transcriptional regulator [Candidatus Thiodiazotropha taylori]MCG8108556.1 AraC family transcriptional regulator [Candidatus Thiodiazotropha taylori]MCG8112384.1 AraC family transcriptional regulator [Candidatus Thiodiazotropha taylori]MCW4280894.1 AraC family transcriptional regulator [Candidatus Thiodiazotropha taylori]
MKRASNFVISPSWAILFKDMQVDMSAVLKHANLPADLFIREDASLTPAQYYQFWRSLEVIVGEQNVALLLAKHLSVESFDPAIFACICSPDLNTALNRLKDYKPLIGPMVLTVNISSRQTRLSIDCYGYEENMPSSLGITELVFFTQLARIATRTEIRPLAVQLPILPEELQPYEDYFGCRLKPAKEVVISFSAKDAAMPFLTSNAAIWSFFEGKLNQRLKDLDASASFTERVRSVLLEALPSGDSSIESVAQRLAMSKRTLQRKLTDEAETYQSVLQNVRSELADHYLKKSHLSLGEISFMLGFQETNSFIRAYSSWKGVSPGLFRERFQ